MSWLILVVAGLFETVWAIGLKYTDGFSKLWPSIFTLLAMVVSVWLLGLAMKTLPVSTAYSVWVGIGVVGTVLVGAFCLGESLNIWRVVSIGLVSLGVVGLKLA
jgi:quaternary ammonium compound-resistance protein SugE